MKAGIKRDNILLLPSAVEYAEEMEALQFLVYEATADDYGDCLTADMFRRHMQVFPEGQFIALDTDSERIVGLTASMRMNFDITRPFAEPWVVTIGHGWLTTHAPSGEWMYGVETCVHPAYQGQGVGGRLMEARCAVARRLNLRGIVAGSAIIDYGAVADTVPVEQYVADVVAGRRFDRNLSKQLKKGFRVHNVIPNYLQDDPRSAGWGVTIVWENAAFRGDIAYDRRGEDRVLLPIGQEAL
jgi:GNAT superfamily N-acetyltransferase